MSTDNNPNEAVNAQTETAANGSQTATSSTTPTPTAQRRGPDKRFVWGIVAVLVVLGFVFLHSNNAVKYEKVPVSDNPPLAQTPIEEYPAGPAYDPSLPEESAVSSTTVATSEPEATSTEVELEDGEKDVIIDKKSGVDASGGIGYTDYNKFKQKDIPEGGSRLIMGDEAILTTINFAKHECPIFAGSQFFYEVCGGSLRLPSDQNPSLSRAAYGMQTKGREVQFYHMPLCLISKADWDKILKSIEAASKEDPNRTVSFNVAFQQTNQDIQKMAADQLNQIYQLEGDKAILPTQIRVAPYSSFDVYIGSDKEPTYQGGNGEDVGFTISGKVSDLKNKFFPIIKYQSGGFPFRVVYHIDGEICQRNLQQETISRVMSINNIYNYYKDRKVEFSSIDGILAGGGTVNLNCGIFSGTFKEADKETYSKSELTGYVEESELNTFYVRQKTAIKRIFDIQFGKEPEAVTQVPDWKELFPNLTALVIPLKEDGTVDIKPDDKDKEEKEKLFNDFWTALKSKLNNSPEAVDTLKKLLPEESLEKDGKGIINVRAERFFGLDIVKRKFREGIKIYKLNQADIEQGLEFFSLGIKHIYGSYPVTASAVLFYGKTSQILQQGYYTIPLGGNTGFPVGVHGIIGGNVPVDGNFYFVTQASVLNSDKTSNDYCLGTCLGYENNSIKPGTNFVLNVHPEYDKNTRIISVVLECVIENDENGGPARGKYVLQKRYSGINAVDAENPEIHYPDTVEAGTILSVPKNRFVSDQNMYSSYDDTYECLSISKVLKSREIRGHENGYNHMTKNDEIRENGGESFLTGYHSGDLWPWFFEQEKINNPFNMDNITYNSREKDDTGRLIPGLIQKSLLYDDKDQPITANAFQFEGEHHNVYTTDERNAWHRFWGMVHFSCHQRCQTYYNVQFKILAGNKLKVPYTYAVKPAEMEYTVVGSIGGGTHFFLNSKTNHWEALTEEEYNARLTEVQNNISK